MSRLSIASWGPAAWTIMHATSFTYPTKPTPQDRRRMHVFLYALAAVLPCRKCREDWQRYLDANVSYPESSHLADRESLSRFLVQGHNRVNEKLGKRTVPYETVAEWYLQAEPADPRLVWGCVALLAIAAALFARSRRQRAPTP